MNRVATLGVILVLVFVLSVPGMTQFGQQESFAPSWKVGDKWVLEASYRDLNHNLEVWLPPVQWVFRVRAIKERHGVQCYVIHVFSRHGELKEQAVLWLATSDLRPIRVIDIFPTSEKMSFSEREIDMNNPQPLLSNDSLIPYDLPVFPLKRANESIQNADGFDAYRSVDNKKKYVSVKKVGSLSFKRTLNQESKKPEKQYSDSFSAYRSMGSTYQVEVIEKRSDTNIVQLWQEGLPWAASSHNRARKVRLVPDSELRRSQQKKTGGKN